MKIKRALEIVCDLASENMISDEDADTHELMNHRKEQAQAILLVGGLSEFVRMNHKQYLALRAICGRYNVRFNPEKFLPVFDLPEDYVTGWVGDHICVGCDPEGRISS